MMGLNFNPNPKPNPKHMRVHVDTGIQAYPRTRTYVRVLPPPRPLAPSLTHMYEEKIHMYTMYYGNVLKYDDEKLENVSMAIYIGPPVTEIEIF
jgi:hypothetical protein